MPTPIELVGGLAGAIGCDFRQSHNQLVFVEYGGKLSTFNLFPAASIVSQGTAVLKGTFSFDLDAGTESAPGAPVGTSWDIFWEQETATARRMTPQFGATIANLGVVPFAGVTASSLQSLAYSATPITGDNSTANKLVTGDVFAVKTNSGNYAKVLVTNYDYNMTIQWVTYHLAAAYNVIGTGYNQPEDVEVSSDDAHAYITERSGDLVKVALSSILHLPPIPLPIQPLQAVSPVAHPELTLKPVPIPIPIQGPNRANATVIASGLVAPQQIALDEAHNQAYVVEYDPAGHGYLYRIGLTAPYPKQAIVSNLIGATGLVISSDLQYAYISEQTTGPDTGRVSRFSLTNGTRQPLVTGLVSPFQLSWADDGESALLVAERDPANRVSRINLSASPVTSNVVVSGLAARPSSVALASPSQMLVCCDSELESVALSPFSTTGPLLMGIGFIPFDKVQPTGLADTTVDPTYFYQVKNVPFGGTLPLMVNHQLAASDGAAYYRVLVYKDVAMTMLELVDTAPITDEKWNGSQYVAVTTATVTIAGKSGYLPVHPVSDLFLWYNPSLGAFLDSTLLPNGKNTIVFEFINATGGAIATTPPLTILVDNNPCSASIGQPTLGGSTADTTCGLLHYTGKTPPQVVMPFTASHPNNFANYSFTLLKGTATLTPPSTHGPVTAVVSPVVGPLATLLGTCTIAGFAEYVYVSAAANNGWGSQTQYDASAAVAFVLAP